MWGGDAACIHVWGTRHDYHEIREEVRQGKSRTSDRFNGKASCRFNGNHQKHFAGSFCTKCNAWLGQLGQEPEPQLSLYVDHLVEIFNEVWRVLRSDGTVWLNLGDSYVSADGSNNEADHSRTKT